MPAESQIDILGKIMNTSEAYHSANNGDNNSSHTALFELKSFMDEIASYDNNSSGIINTDENYDPLEHRKLILEKLKNLLRLSISELVNEDNPDLIPGSEAEYSPDHEQLKSLLEISLFQLALLSTDVTYEDNVADGLHVLDELKNVLDKTGMVNNDLVNAEACSTSSNPESAGTDQYHGNDDMDTDGNDYLLYDEVNAASFENDQQQDFVVLRNDASSITVNIDIVEDIGDAVERENTAREDMISEPEEHTEDIDISAGFPDVTEEHPGAEEIHAPDSDPVMAALNDSTTDNQTYTVNIKQDKDKPGNKHLLFAGGFLLITVLAATAIYLASSGKSGLTIDTTELADGQQPAQNDAPAPPGFENSQTPEAGAAASIPAESETTLPDPLAENDEYYSFLVSLKTEGNKTEAGVSDGTTDTETNNVKATGISSATQAAEPVSLPAEAANTTTENKTDLLTVQQQTLVTENNAENATPLASNISLARVNVAAIEPSMANTRADIKKMQELKSVRQDSPVTITGSIDNKNAQQADEMTGISELPDKAESEITSILSNPQQPSEDIDQPEVTAASVIAVQEPQVPGAVRSIESIVSEMNLAYKSKQASAETTEQSYAIWSVYLSSYYGNPPPHHELGYLDKADVPYEIRKVSVNDADWYRVVVNNSMEYKTAKAYAEMIKAKLGKKKIWISKKNYTYE